MTLIRSGSPFIPHYHFIFVARCSGHGRSGAVTVVAAMALLCFSFAYLAFSFASSSSGPDRPMAQHKIKCSIIVGMLLARKKAVSFEA